MSSSMRRIVLSGVFLLSTALPALAIMPKPCVGGSLPISSFKLLVLPSKSTADGLPLRSVNLVQSGDKLKFEPLRLPQSIRQSAKIALVMVPSSEADGKHIAVLDPKPADAPAEWTVPMRSSVVGLIFGPHGLDMKKVHKLVKKNPDLIPELANYAHQTATVNALVSTLSEYENSAPGSQNLNAVLTGFSNRYGVSLPTLSSGETADQQASVLLRAVIPTIANYDPMASSRALVMQQSAGLAASVASLFYGTPIGLAVGGAALVQNLHTAMSPDTDFRAAFVQSSDSSDIELCSHSQAHRPRTRLAYLWMLQIPDAEIPTAALAENVHVLSGSEPNLEVTCATHAQLRVLPRAREWRLVSPDAKAVVPAKIDVGSKVDTVSIDLSQANLPPGQYHLEALWDWDWFKLGGILHVHPFSDFSTARITPDSQDLLVHGAGPVEIHLTGADFEFVNKVAIAPAGADDPKPQELQFKLPKGPGAGDQQKMQVSVDTSSVAAGKYNLLLTQLDGNTQAVPAVIHAPNPQLQNLPLRANIDEKQQELELHGTGLERIDSLISQNATWILPPLPDGSTGVTEREAIIKLAPNAKKGDVLNARMVVAGIHDPIEVDDLVQVAGPRPKILSVDESLPKGGTVALDSGEIPAGSPASFAIHTADVDSRPALELACAGDPDGSKPLDLDPGHLQGTTQLDFAGRGVLFLSVDPGAVGPSGCELQAMVSTSDTGTSDAYPLGRVVRLPQIDKFTLTDQKSGRSLYVGYLTGQNLQMIDKTGWNANSGYPVEGIPTPVPGSSLEQTLQIQLSWPPPSPGAPVYIWIRGEGHGRRTTATY